METIDDDNDEDVGDCGHQKDGDVEHHYGNILRLYIQQILTLPYVSSELIYGETVVLQANRSVLHPERLPRHCSFPLNQFYSLPSTVLLICSAKDWFDFIHLTMENASSHTDAHTDTCYGHTLISIFGVGVLVDWHFHWG